MTRVLLILIGFSLSACGYASPPRAISADLDAAWWNGPTSLHPGQTIDLRDEPQGTAPWIR